VDSVGSVDAKAHLPALLERVSKGESIQITRRGVPVAILAPARPQAKDRRELAEQIRKVRIGNRLGSLSVRKLIKADRRY
jgi:prevent-host-death family protein